MKNLLVTGGCGFIGSNFINYVGDTFPDITITNIDKLDYCSREDNVYLTKSYKFYKCDINNIEFVLHILKENNIDTIIHFAAQSHVDNSFGNSLSFSQDNVLGTHSLLECVRKYGKIERFIHISTDEVYGEVEKEHTGCTETSLLNPTNPYAATKAAAEFIVRSYYYSYKLPVIIVRGNNVYGPRQYPEKLIPRFITNLLDNKKCTIHGRGDSIRNFIFAKDFARGVVTILQKGEIFNIYNIGTSNEFSVMEITNILVKRLKPDDNVDDWIVYVEDRLFNDKRYCIDNSNLRELGWEEQTKFMDGLEETIEWYTARAHKI